MRHKRLREVKPSVARIAGSTGLNPGDSAVVSLVNRAVEELINEGEWPGTTDRYRATIQGGWFVLPDEFVSVKYLSSDNTQHPVKGEWFEFMDYGPGVQGEDSASRLSHGVLDRGVSTVFSNVPETGGPWRLRVRSDRAEDADIHLWVRCYDERGAPVTNVETEGPWIWIPMPTTRGTHVTSDQYVGKVDETPGGIILSEGRKGGVTLTAYNGTDDVILAHYEPGVALPQFRRYFLPGLGDGEHTIVVKASRRFRPVYGDEDVLQISNLPALELMTLALRSKDNAQVEEYFNYKRLAVEELKKERKRYHDEEPHVSFRASVAFGYGFPGET